MLAPTAEVDFEETRLLDLGQNSLELYPGFVSELEDKTGESLGYLEEGTIVVAVDRDEAEQLERLNQYHERLGLDARRLAGAEFKKLEPSLSPELHAGLFLSGDHQVDPQLLVSALAEAVRQSGGAIREGAEIEEVVVNSGEVQALRFGGERIPANRVVLCAGAWTNRIEGIPGGVLPRIRPVRGQMIAVELGNPPLCSHVVRGPDAYLVPKPERNRLLIGATTEEMGFDSRMTAGGVFELLRGAWEVLPGVYHHHIEDWWTGFRPTSLDNLPVIGPTDLDGLWVATGHGRGGILLAPLTAEIVAEGLMSGQIPSDYADLTP
jgi:glycine oxidase